MFIVNTLTFLIMFFLGLLFLLGILIDPIIILLGLYLILFYYLSKSKKKESKK